MYSTCTRAHQRPLCGDAKTTTTSRAIQALCYLENAECVTLKIVEGRQNTARNTVAARQVANQCFQHGQFYITVTKRIRLFHTRSTIFLAAASSNSVFGVMQVLQLRRWSGRWVECSGVGVMEVHIVLRLTFNLKKKKEETQGQRKNTRSRQKIRKKKISKNKFLCLRSWICFCLPSSPPTTTPTLILRIIKRRNVFFL